MLKIIVVSWLVEKSSSAESINFYIAWHIVHVCVWILDLVQLSVLIAGGHLDVIRLLIEHNADVDSQDNRKVSCLMAAFRRVRAHTCSHYD